jgi:hypothetical protein
MCASRPLFGQTGLKNMCELYIFYSEVSLGSPRMVRKTACAARWQIFQQLKVRQRMESEKLGEKSHFCIERPKTL